MADKINYGGGAMFANKSACQYFPWDRIERKRDARNGNPELSGRVEITKTLVKKMVEMFKAENTQTSKRGDDTGEQVVVMDIAGLRRTSRSGLDYFSVWFSDEYKKEEPVAPTPSSNMDDEIPF
jgi:hypothetical protein